MLLKRSEKIGFSNHELKVNSSPPKARKLQHFIISLFFFCTLLVNPGKLSNSRHQYVFLLLRQYVKKYSTRDIHN